MILTKRPLLLALAAASLAACGEDGEARDPGSPRPSAGVADKNERETALPWFEESALARGIDFVHQSGATGKFLMPEIMTTGAALFDADGDGDLDAYLAQAGSLDSPRAGRPGNRLYENLGGGRFQDVTEASGADDRGYAMGVATGDFNGDGRVDLFVSNLGKNALLRGDGNLKFTDVTDEAGLAGSTSWSASAAFVDFEGDGDLDLFVTSYIEWDAGSEIVCKSPRNTRTYCSPKTYGRPAIDQMFENQGDGTFVDISSRAGLKSAYGNGLGVVCADFDLDGTVEIFVANDGTPNQLWDRRADGSYADTATGLGCAVDLQGRAKAGMGVAAADYDHDGDEDLLVVNLTGEDDSFYRNDGGQFVDKAAIAGLAGVSRKRTRFGVALRDFDLDGHIDVFHANGRVTEPGNQKFDDPFAEENVVLRGSTKGRFSVLTPGGGVAEPLVGTSRAAAFGDVDDDGDVDVLVHNRDGRAHLLINVAPRQVTPILIDVRTAAGAPAIGATVMVRAAGQLTRHEVRTADSYGAGSSHLLHLARPGATPIDRIEVIWPDGRAALKERVAPGSMVRFEPPPK